jgi:hypothetical protein
MTAKRNFCPPPPDDVVAGVDELPPLHANEPATTIANTPHASFLILGISL